MNTNPVETAMTDVQIQVRDNGPLLVSGPVTLVDANGAAFDLGDKETSALCRWGAAENAPRGDGSHNSCGFDSTVAAGGD